MTDILLTAAALRVTGYDTEAREMIAAYRDSGDPHFLAGYRGETYHHQPGSGPFPRKAHQVGRLAAVMERRS